MTVEDRDERRAEIEAAAYGLLTTRGYGGMSMLAVAKAARASNETLYRWYGDKAGLVAAMVARNAAEVTLALEAAEVPRGGLEAQLETIGVALLTMLVGGRSVALNRAAAGDASGALGREIAAGGRDVVLPRIAAVLARHGMTEGAETFVALLVGDWQLRRVIGVMEMPAPEAIATRARVAVGAFLVLQRAAAGRGR